MFASQVLCKCVDFFFRTPKGSFKVPTVVNITAHAPTTVNQHNSKTSNLDKAKIEQVNNKNMGLSNSKDE